MDRREVAEKIGTELRGLAGLAQMMEKSTDETLMALADLIGPAIDRLFGLVEELQSGEEPL